MATAERYSLSDEHDRAEKDERARVDRLEAELAEQVKYAQRLIHERDAALERAEQSDAAKRLWVRTHGFMPVVGVTCDGAGCAEAIGVVGVKMVDIDTIGEACEDLAGKIGWQSTTDLVEPRHDHEDGDLLATKHYCPRCAPLFVNK